MAQQRIVFVHGAGRFGAAAWPAQHALARSYDCLFLRRAGARKALPTGSAFGTQDADFDPSSLNLPKGFEKFLGK